MIAAAHAKDMLTTPYVFSADEATAMAKAGADIVVCHLGLTTGGSIGAETALKLEDCPAKVDAWAEAALKVRRDVIVLVHGGPVVEPRGCGLHHKQHEELPRLLRCVINGAPADRGGAHRADAEVQGHWAAARVRNETGGGAWRRAAREWSDVHDCTTDRGHHPVADRGDHRDRDHRLPGQLALPALLQGGVVRPHRPHGRAGGDRRRRLRAADHPRHHAGQHERAADERGARQGRRAHHQGPHARRHRRRLLRARRADAGRGRAGRRDARPAHHGAGAAARAPVRQVRLGAALGRLRDDHGGDARAARASTCSASRRPPPRRWRRTASSSRPWR